MRVFISRAAGCTARVDASSACQQTVLTIGWAVPAALANGGMDVTGGGKLQIRAGIATPTCDEPKRITRSYSTLDLGANRLIYGG